MCVFLKSSDKNVSTSSIRLRRFSYTFDNYCCDSWKYFSASNSFFAIGLVASCLFVYRFSKERFSSNEMRLRNLLKKERNFSILLELKVVMDGLGWRLCWWKVYWVFVILANRLIINILTQLEILKIRVCWSTLSLEFNHLCPQILTKVPSSLSSRFLPILPLLLFCSPFWLPSQQLSNVCEPFNFLSSCTPHNQNRRLYLFPKPTLLHLCPFPYNNKC